MKGLIEIRWHGRGGQGAVTAANILAEVALSVGKFVQAFPEFGPERAGAPVKSFNRISNSPIRIHSQITHPDIVVVLDVSLLSTVDVCDGLKNSGYLIINTKKSPADIRVDTGTEGADTKVAAVDATEIAVREFRRNIPNTPMIAALVKVTEILEFETLLNGFKERFSRKFSSGVLEANVRAMKEAYVRVRVG